MKVNKLFKKNVSTCWLEQKLLHLKIFAGHLVLSVVLLLAITHHVTVHTKQVEFNLIKLINFFLI